MAYTKTHSVEQLNEMHLPALPLKNLHHFISKLYLATSKIELAEYRDWALAQLQSLIAFDGAIWKFSPWLGFNRPFGLCGHFNYYLSARHECALRGTYLSRGETSPSDCC